MPMHPEEWKQIVQEIYKKLLKQFKSESQWKTELKTTDCCVGLVCAGLSFPVCLGFIQTSIFLPMRISSRFPRVSSVVGCLSVGVSGAVASLSFISSALASKWLEAKFGQAKVLSSLPYHENKLQFSFSKSDIVFYALGSVIVFKCLRGRFRFCVPSHLFYPGSFARQSVPASGQTYAAASAKTKLFEIGRKFGCHTCGRRVRKEVIGDHMPPNKLVKRGQTQVFYPQCAKCSQRQGGVLSTMSKRIFLKTHATTLRLCHLWLPVPVAVSAVKQLF